MNDIIQNFTGKSLQEIIDELGFEMRVSADGSSARFVTKPIYDDQLRELLRVHTLKRLLML
jgi:hypothetical protein